MSVLMAGTTSTAIGGGGGPVTLIVNVSPTDASRITHGPSTGQTNAVTATVSNGVGPYSFSWTYLTGNTTFNCISPTNSTTRWQVTLQVGQTKSSWWRVTVTDSAGNIGYKDIVVYGQDISYEGDIPL